MANTLRIKRRVSGSTGAPSSLKTAELAWNMADDTLYGGYGDDGSGNATSIKPLGGEGTFAKLASPTFTGTPAAPTPTAGDSSTKLATTAFVAAAIAGFSSGTVTSVALSLPAIFSVSGSPVTSSGTLTATLATQTAKYVWAGPTSGAAAAPTFRALVAGDLPDLSSSYLPISGGTISSDLTISGNLTVNGTTTTINSTTLAVDDKNIVLGDVSSPSDATADGGGITLKGATDKTLNWVDATDAWTSSEHLNLASGKAFYINGTSVLSGSTLGSGVTSSSLTSVGTIGTGVWQGTTVGVAYGGTGATSFTSGALLKGAGTSAITVATAGTDYLDPSSTLDCGTF